MVAASLRRGFLDPLSAVNGIISGLVGITAGCHLMTPFSSAIIGAISGIICVFAIELLTRLKIDDAVGAIPAHLFAGIWGTLAVALLADLNNFGNDLNRWDQFQIQLTGVLVVGFYAFNAGFALLWVINRFYPLRVNECAERKGLNVSEHGEATEILDLLTEMQTQRDHGDFSNPVSDESSSEVGQIAKQYNRVLGRVNDEIQQREKVLGALFQSEARKSAIMETALDSIITIDHKGIILEFNSSAERTFGYTRKRVIGRPVDTVILAEDYREEFRTLLETGFSGGGRWILGRRVTVTLIRIHETMFPAEVAITAVRRDTVPEYTLHLRDVSKQHEIQQRLTYLARYDNLTGLSNRAYFLERLDYYIKRAKPANDHLSLMFLDLDRFKNVNDVSRTPGWRFALTYSCRSFEKRGT